MKLWNIISVPRSVVIIMMYLLSPCREDIKKDLKKIGAKEDWWGLHAAMQKKEPFRNLFFYRTAQHMPILTKLSKLTYRPYNECAIYADRIGGGMTVYHGNSTIVFAKEIGENFSVYQQVTIGRGKTINGNDIPVIGDNVNVYAGAIIVGGVRIGNGASIGAGAVVVKDVPDNAVVVGAPVRIIQK
jgi:serine O-acetyltransferase